jgi:hypothetical protein
MYNKKLLSKIDLGKYSKSDPYKKDIIYDPMGQWKYPGQPTRIPSSNITMKGVNFPVLAVTDNGQKKMMQPGQEYNFPGANYVDEFPQAKKGGSLKSKKYTRSLDGIGSLFVESALFKKPKNNRKRIFHPKAKYYAEGGEPCPQGFQEDPVTGECIPIREKVEDIQEMPSSILQKPPYYQESFVNPAAYVSGYRGGNPRMYKYGFLDSGQGNIVGGGGFGFPKPGVHLSALGVVPTSSNDRQYFKGAYEAGISKDLKNLNLGLGVGTAITGYPEENGFVRDPIKLQPKLNLRYNFAQGGMPDPGDVTCPEGYEINTITGRCVLIKGEPGFIKNDVGEWVQDVAGKTVVEDENDERYKDYLIRKHLSDISKIPDFSRRRGVLYDFIKTTNDPTIPANSLDRFWETYYDPEKGYDWTMGGTEDELIDETNKGIAGSRVQLFNDLTEDQLNETTAKQFLNDQGFPTQDRFDFRNYKDYVLANYKPDSYLGRAYLNGLSNNYFARELDYSDMKKPNSNSREFRTPITSVVEDKINRDRLKEIYPDLTDKDINDAYQSDANSYLSNDIVPQKIYHMRDDLISYKKLLETKMSNQNDNAFRDYVNSTEKADDMFTRNNHVYYKPEDVRDYIISGLAVLPNYSEPIDKYIVRKTIDNADPSVELYTNPDAPEYSPTNTSVDRRTLDIKLPSGNIKALFDKGRMGSKGHIHRGEREGTKFIPSLVQKFTGYDKDYMEGYIDDDGNYVPGEIENAQTEGRQINFKGRSSLNDKKAQEAYTQEWTQYQIEKDAVRQKNIELLQKYNLPTEEYLANTKKQGGSISKYNINTEHDLTEAEVARLKKLGYKLEKL